MALIQKKDEKTKSQLENAPQDTEITEKINELKLDNANLKAIQSAMPDPYYIRDMDYNIILWPDAIAKLTGYSAEEAKKLKCYEMFKAGVCPPNCDCPTQNCIKTKQFLRDVAVDVYHKNGSPIHSLVSNAGIYDENGAAIGAVEVVKDNTAVQSSMNQIGELIKNIDQVAVTMAGIMNSVSDTSKKVGDKAHESLSNTKLGMQVSREVFDKAENSSKYVSTVQGEMKSIDNSMKQSIEKVVILKNRSDEIIEFVKIIQDISAKTNLLAINASIEAAHAGEIGRGFKVVADGIRELSKNSSESANSIKVTIQEITRLIRETTESIENIEKSVSKGADEITQLLGFVNDIDGSTKELMNSLQSMERAAEVTTEMGDEQLTSVNEMNKAGKELSAIAEALAKEFKKVFAAIQHTDMG